MDNDFLAKAGKVFTELVNVAIFLRDHGFAERALDSFFVLSAGDPTFEAGTYAFEIGRCYENMKDEENAAKYFAIAVANNPSIFEFREAASRLGLSIPPDPV